MDDEDQTPQQDNSEERTLTSTERAALRNLGKVNLPKIRTTLPDSVLKSIADATDVTARHMRLLDSVMPATKLSKLGIAGLDTKGLLGKNFGLAGLDTKGLIGRHSALSDLAAQQSKLLDSIKPSIRIAELAGAKANIAGSFAKLGVGQAAWTSQLMKNVDFGLSKQMQAAAKSFTVSQSKVWESVAASARLMARSFYPSNLRDIEGITLSAVKAVAFDEGIPLYLVPGQETAELLLRADSLEDRIAILAERSDLIVEDCREVLTACQSERMEGYVAKVDEAAAALAAGFPSAAQALVSSVVESLVWDYFGHDKKRFLPNKRKKVTPEAYDKMDAHEFLAFAPVWQAFQQYELSKGDPIPLTFSRHATAHTVSPEQYKPVNALQGLMLVTGLVVFMDASAALEQAA